MDNKQIQSTLNAHGFPCGKVDGDIGPNTKAAVARFQMAFNIGPWLVIDGIPGPRTQAALGNLPHLSENFVVAELRSHGDGTCYIKRELLKGLEEIRDLVGPLHIISAYRDPVHNKRVGGASKSMHLFGYGADIPPVCSWTRIRDMHTFSGIGIRFGAISHVDMRHLAGENNLTPKATPLAPAVWNY